MTQNPINHGGVRRFLGLNVRVGWIVSVIALLCVCFGLISWRITIQLRDNFAADRARDTAVINLALRNQYDLCVDRVEARVNLGVILTGGNNSDRTQNEIVDEFVDGLPSDLLADLTAVLDGYQAQIDAAYPATLKVAIECAKYKPPES